MDWMEIEHNVLQKIPIAVSDSIRNFMSLYHGNLEEIRLRSHRPVALTVDGKNIPLSCHCNQKDLQETTRMLCDNALYSHAETIREGYICTAEGIRVGICGRAITENGKITLLRDVSSLCIRIPRRVPDAGRELIQILADHNFSKNVLIYSPPGGGKTTVLREVAVALSSGPVRKRVAVVDSRFEICTGLTDGDMLDILYGYPRALGMEIALRTLSPEFIICDEIASAEDRQALLNCCGSGVHFCTSAHACSFADLQHHPILKEIVSLFDWGYELNSFHEGTLIHIPSGGKYSV